MTEGALALAVQALGPIGAAGVFVLLAWKGFLEANSARKSRERELAEAALDRQAEAEKRAMERYEGLLAQMDARLAQFESQIGVLETRVANKDAQIDQLEAENEGLDVRIAGLEAVQRRAMAYVEQLLDFIATQSAKMAAHGVTMDTPPRKPDGL